MKINGLLLLGALALVLPLAGCGGGPTPLPIVDLHGVDQVTYNDDLAYCVDNQEFGFGNAVTRCMKAKGYKILVGY